MGTFLLVILIGLSLTREPSVPVLCQSPFITVEDFLIMAQNWRLIFLTLSLCISTLYSQLPKKEKYYAIKEDIPRIKCETCQKAVKYLYGKTHDMRTAEGGTSKSRKVQCLTFARIIFLVLLIAGALLGKKMMIKTRRSRNRQPWNRCLSANEYHVDRY